MGFFQLVFDDDLAYVVDEGRKRNIVSLTLKHDLFVTTVFVLIVLVKGVSVHVLKYISADTVSLEGAFANFPSTYLRYGYVGLLVCSKEESDSCSLRCLEKHSCTLACLTEVNAPAASLNMLT